MKIPAIIIAIILACQVCLAEIFIHYLNQNEIRNMVATFAELKQLMEIARVRRL